MNGPPFKPPKKIAAPTKRKSPLAKLETSDREFLPAALEILETPPSPIKIGLGLAICSLAALAVFWSFIGRLDVYATAHGRLVTETKPSVVQSLVTGKIKSIDVQNGSHVEQGQTLATLEPTEAEADEAASKHILSSSEAEVARRTAAILAANAVKKACNDVLSNQKNCSVFDSITFVAPKARSRNSMYFAAPLTVKCGVRE